MRKQNRPDGSLMAPVNSSKPVLKISPRLSGRRHYLGVDLCGRVLGLPLEKGSEERVAPEHRRAARPGKETDATLDKGQLFGHAGMCFASEKNGWPLNIVAALWSSTDESTGLIVTKPG